MTQVTFLRVSPIARCVRGVEAITQIEALLHGGGDGALAQRLEFGEELGFGFGSERDSSIFQGEILSFFVASPYTIFAT